MKLEYLNEFLTLTELLNYQQAAEKLYLSQSTLSKHIISLEKELNCTLINRNHRNQLTLTADGQIVKKYAQLIKTEIHTMYENLHHSHDHLIMNISFSQVMYEYHILDKVNESMIKQPHLKFRLIETPKNKPFSFLDNADVDIAFIQENRPLNTTLVKNFYAEPLVAIVAPKSSLLQVDLEQSAEKLIIPNDIQKEFIKYRNLIINNGSLPVSGIPFESNWTKNIVEMVSHGLGIGILPQKKAQYYQNSIKIVPLLPSTKVYINLYINPRFQNKSGRVELPLPFKNFINLIFNK